VANIETTVNKIDREVMGIKSGMATTKDITATVQTLNGRIDPLYLFLVGVLASVVVTLLAVILSLWLILRRQIGRKDYGEN